jgi:hypothetical protein
MNETKGDFKKKMVRDDPLPTIKDIEREMDKETQFNNEYFLSQENIKAAKRTDPTQTIVMASKRKNKMWKPDKMGHSKVLSFILKGV